MESEEFNANLDEPLPDPSKGEVVQHIGKFVEKKSKAHLDSIKKFEQNKLNKRREHNRRARKARKRNR